MKYPTHALAVQRQLLVPLFLLVLAMAGHAGAAPAAAPERVLTLAPAPGTPARGDTQLLLPQPALAARSADTSAALQASTAFLAAVRARDCNAAMTYVDAAAYRLGPGDQPAHCQRMFASFERFGAFTVQAPVPLSGVVLIPLKPQAPGDWRVLTFRKTGERWLFSESQEPGSLVPLVLSALRTANLGVQPAPALASLPLRTVVLEDGGAQGRLALRARLVAGPASTGPTAALMAYYAGCISREGLAPGALERYLACLRPDLRSDLKSSYDAQPPDRRLALYNSLTAPRTIDYVLVDGPTAVIFFTETASGRHWRDVVHQTAPGSFALDNPMKSGSVDMALNGERVRAAVQAQAR
ncbi:hypothetical protein IP91_00804 [Pseudoduganella lurida]|uniref:Uncharacterized protein n=1 Tax=Pseudoduganella lurida TaxID=1036180 RepID=A0A562RL34_9BURK|nr:hypothetical protein [Pseudoduganella lurida]TWI69731.1 hypothetical protein IP91_00804 [Pseudoduganella lurida]